MQTRQELSHSLYQYEAACRVIARLAKERDALKESVYLDSLWDLLSSPRSLSFLLREVASLHSHAATNSGQAHHQEQVPAESRSTCLSPLFIREIILLNQSLKKTDGGAEMEVDHNSHGGESPDTITPEILEKITTLSQKCVPFFFFLALLLAHQDLFVFRLAKERKKRPAVDGLATPEDLFQFKVCAFSFFC